MTLLGHKLWTTGRRIASKRMHATFNKSHEASSRILNQSQYRLWWEKQTIKVMKCPRNYSPKEDSPNPT